MHENRLLKIAYICSIIGILFLFYISQTQDFETKTLDDINNEDIGKTYKMKGKVTKISEKNDTLAITITQEVKKTIFFTNKENIPKINDTIEFKAKINEYKGKISINGEHIKNSIQKYS
ncbi:hypothetical protein ACFLZX_02890 [Nanoarchaeota archaeon]